MARRGSSFFIVPTCNHRPLIARTRNGNAVVTFTVLVNRIRGTWLTTARGLAGRSLANPHATGQTRHSWVREFEEQSFGKEEREGVGRRDWPRRKSGHVHSFQNILDTVSLYCVREITVRPPRPNGIDRTSDRGNRRQDSRSASAADSSRGGDAPESRVAQLCRNGRAGNGSVPRRNPAGRGSAGCG